MSWVEKELKKRTTESKLSTQIEPALASEAERMMDLWGQFLAANNVLPNELQLQVDRGKTLGMSSEEASVSEWLRAPNGAALGFAGTAVRYVWPERSLRRSKNFWIRWQVQDQRYVLRQRVGTSVPPAVAEYRFNDAQAAYMVKCLVLGKRVTPAAVRRKRFWVF